MTGGRRTGVTLADRRERKYLRSRQQRYGNGRGDHDREDTETQTEVEGKETHARREKARDKKRQRQGKRILRVSCRMSTTLSQEPLSRAKEQHKDGKADTDSQNA